MSAEKIGPQHRGRKAVLYVRQSSAHQVQYNRESQALQYAMRERLAQLGGRLPAIIRILAKATRDHAIDGGRCAAALCADRRRF